MFACKINFLYLFVVEAVSRLRLANAEAESIPGGQSRAHDSPRFFAWRQGNAVGRSRGFIAYLVKLYVFFLTFFVLLHHFITNFRTVDFFFGTMQT